MRSTTSRPAQSDAGYAMDSIGRRTDGCADVRDTRNSGEGGKHDASVWNRLDCWARTSGRSSLPRRRRSCTFRSLFTKSPRAAFGHVAVVVEAGQAIGGLKVNGNGSAGKELVGQRLQTLGCGSKLLARENQARPGAPGFLENTGGDARDAKGHGMTKCISPESWNRQVLDGGMRPRRCYGRSIGMSEVDQRVNPRFTRRLHRSRELGVVHGAVALLRQELRLNNID